MPVWYFYSLTFVDRFKEKDANRSNYFMW